MVENKYALLGCYDNENRPNIEILATSDDIGELAAIKILINRAIEISAFGNLSELNTEENRIAEELDKVVPIFDERCEYFEQVEATGIYELKEVDATPKELPKANINGKIYYRDDRLSEYRNVENPYDRIPFAELVETDKK